MTSTVRPPGLASHLLATLMRRRAHRRFTKPRRYDRNLIIIGAGAAGLTAASVAAQARAAVTLVEARAMGGDCLNTGCIPSKTLISSARVADTLRRAHHFGIESVPPQVAFREVMARVQATIRALAPHDSVDRFTAMGVHVVPGTATIADPWTVEIVGHDGVIQRLTTRSILIATGAAPTVPAIPGLQNSGFLTSDTIWSALAAMDAAPEQVVVLGGGPFGCEISQALARLGSRVTLLERGAHVLSREDTDVSALVRASLEASGVQVLTSHEALRVEAGAVIAEHQGHQLAVPFRTLIVAAGRTARLTGFGLEALGVDTTSVVTTNACLATSFPSIFAAGDVAGPSQFTHAAGHQASSACLNALFGPWVRFRADHRVIPSVTFLDPEIARVGLTERDAALQGIPVEVTRFELARLDRAVTDSHTAGFVKVLTPPGRDTILGACIVGAHAGECLAEYVLAMTHGIGLRRILRTVHAYPTMAEATRLVAGRWQANHLPAELLRWAERYHAWRRG